MMLTAVSNSIVALLDDDGLDEIHHVIELVFLGIDPIMFGDRSCDDFAMLNACH